MTVNVFAVPVFFVVFRETLETVVIVSVLLAFLKQALGGPDQDAVLRKRLVKQVGSYQMELLGAKVTYSRVW
jgi:high-affinity iron transporter